MGKLPFYTGGLWVPLTHKCSLWIKDKTFGLCLFCLYWKLHLHSGPVLCQWPLSEKNLLFPGGDPRFKLSLVWVLPSDTWLSYSHDACFKTLHRFSLVGESAQRDTEALNILYSVAFNTVGSVGTYSNSTTNHNGAPLPFSFHHLATLTEVNLYWLLSGYASRLTLAVQPLWCSVSGPGRYHPSVPTSCSQLFSP